MPMHKPLVALTGALLLLTCTTGGVQAAPTPPDKPGPFPSGNFKIKQGDKCLHTLNLPTDPPIMFECLAAADGGDRQVWQGIDGETEPDALISVFARDTQNRLLDCVDNANAKHNTFGPLRFVNCIKDAPTAARWWWNPGTKRITYRMKLKDGTTKVLYLGRVFDSPVLLDKIPAKPSEIAWAVVPVSG
ncbi:MULTISPECIES: hypothetical protein [unclassified Streptomyces]|uniref:hypothetical protein n=1 Tax=unclassified Streptomyces TaxID=2593676 RepID=UPI003652BFA7